MTTTPETRDEILEEVRSHYGEVARSGGACCAPGCCSPRTGTVPSADDAALRLGYTEADLASTPDGANLGLGCGNPRAIADLRAGETVLDLGSGAGFDCFLAARQVGQTGRVIGVDMTADMVSRARANAGKAGASNVEFRLGEIEHLPIPDGAVDVVISNCVINLSPDKRAVLREAFRVLRPGGRLAISDVVALAPVPDQVRRDLSAYTGCIAGAATIDELEGWLAEAGFDDVSVELDSASTAAMAEAVGTEVDFSRLAAAARIRARRPAAERRS
jgi:arsenite methyltransferase